MFGFFDFWTADIKQGHAFNMKSNLLISQRETPAKVFSLLVRG